MARFSMCNRYDCNEHPKPYYIIPDWLPGERWEMIPDRAAKYIIPYYYISTYGRIWHNYENHFMAISWDGGGYRIAVLRTLNGAKTFRVHRLMMLTFRYYPGCENMVVNHIDGNKTNNYLDFPGYGDNLEWTTQSENEKHAFRIGLKTSKTLQNHPRAKHTNEEIIYICELIQSAKYSKKEIKEMTGANDALIDNLLRGTCWTDITKDYDFSAYRAKSNYYNSTTRKR